MYKKVVKLDDYRPKIIIYGVNYTYSPTKEMLEDYATGKRALLPEDLLRAIVREYIVMMTP